MTLPSEEFLVKLFNQFNKIYWNNSLPIPIIKWNHYITNAGRCYKSTKADKEEFEIILSWKYHMKYPNELIITLKHEMIHLLIPTHNEDFIKEANRIGTRIYSYPFEIPNKYKYKCRICNNVYYEDKLGVSFICSICFKKGYKREHCLLEFEGIRNWKLHINDNNVSIFPTID